MSTSASVSIYVGVALTEQKAKELFGAKFESRIYDACPKDQSPNPEKKKFCGECGMNLGYKVKVSDGVEGGAPEIAYFLEEKFKGLNAEAISCDHGDLEKLIVGKKITETDDLVSSGSDLLEVTEDMAKTVKTVEAKLAKLGINEPVKVYLLASVG